MVGLEKLGNAVLPLDRGDVHIAGDHRAIRNLHDERRIVLAAVWIDEEARKGRRNDRRLQNPSHFKGYAMRADVVSNVPFQLRFIEAERSVFGRQLERGVVAQNEEPRPAGRAACDLDALPSAGSGL